MWDNYIKVTIRNIIKNKTYSIINIIGLAIGITCSIVIMLLVQDELSYNNFHKNAENIYRVNKKYMIGNEVGYNLSTPFPLAETLKDKFSQVDNATKYVRNRFLVTYGEKSFTERRVCLTDTSFFRIFSFDFVQGDSKNALQNPNSIILTEETSIKYFGTVNSLGKVLTIDSRDELIVTGIIKKYSK